MQSTESRWTRYCMCKKPRKLTWCSKEKPRSSCCSYQCWMTTKLMNYYLRRCRGERRLPHYILPCHMWWHSNLRRNDQPPSISVIVHTQISVNSWDQDPVKRNSHARAWRSETKSDTILSNVGGIIALSWGSHVWPAVLDYLFPKFVGVERNFKPSQLPPTCSPYYLWRQIRLARWPINERFETDLPLIQISLISYTYISPNLRVQTESPLLRVLK